MEDLKFRDTQGIDFSNRLHTLLDEISTTRRVGYDSRNIDILGDLVLTLFMELKPFLSDDELKATEDKIRIIKGTRSRVRFPGIRDDLMNPFQMRDKSTAVEDVEYILRKTMIAKNLMLSKEKNNKTVR